MMQIFGRPRRKSLIPNIFRFHFDAHKLKLPLWGVGPYLSKEYNWIWKLFSGMLVRACEFCSLNRACTELVLGRVLRQQSLIQRRAVSTCSRKATKTCKNILSWGFKNNWRDRLWVSWSSSPFLVPVTEGRDESSELTRKVCQEQGSHTCRW